MTFEEESVEEFLNNLVEEVFLRLMLEIITERFLGEVPPVIDITDYDVYTDPITIQ